MSANVCSKAIRLSWSDGETSMCAMSAREMQKASYKRIICLYLQTI